VCCTVAERPGRVSLAAVAAVSTAVMAAGAGAGCGADRIGVVGAPVAAVCSVEVRSGRGRSTVEVETEYLPRVIQCENGPADDEALKALAVAARSYLYYTVGREGSIFDGTADQVFGCGREPAARHRAAVAATRGQVLQYRGHQVAGFYVAGARAGKGTRADACGAGPDPTRTEPYVTYNEGQSGEAVRKSRLGLRHDDNHANRGGLSQHGSHCLARAGYDYRSILRFYYGEDIALASAVGDCLGDEAAAGGLGDRLARYRWLVLAVACAGALLLLRGRDQRPKSGRRRRRRG
jgi:hypothetical protein